MSILRLFRRKDTETTTLAKRRLKETLHSDRKLTTPKGAKNEGTVCNKHNDCAAGTTG